MRDYLARMFCYVAWADRRTLESVRSTPDAKTEALPLVAHLLAAEHVWLSRLLGRDPAFPVWPSLSLDECERLMNENAAGFRSFLESLSDEQLTSPVRYRTSQGQEWVTPALDILTQVITHGPYHRGQIAKIIGRTGGTAINTDFIVFTRETA